MKVLIDTNVIIDVLMNREPFCDHSSAVLRRCGKGLSGFITANQTTDIFYLLRKENKSTEETIAILKKLVTNLSVIDVMAKDVTTALNSPMTDYEDALLAQCAVRARTDYIITRNTKDFIVSPVSGITPTDFMDKFFNVTN
jgi:predicted nucleic acid-binding protein